jgi:predicted RecA/RadA family phage recombinase
MAQTGIQLSDEGKTITILNDSGTTAIYAGDLVYALANDDVLTGTAASARAAYNAATDIKGTAMSASATGYKTVLGVALEDIPVSSVGAIAMEGVFMTPVSDNTEAGDVLQGAASANKVVRIPTVTAGSTTANADKCEAIKYKIGRALTGGSADGKYIIWKLSL